MKKRTISKLFLYRHRFGIFYSILTISFLATLIFLPLIAPNGLSSAEIESVNISSSLNLKSLFSDNIANLPYHLLQKLSLTVFGLTTYGIKLPSIIFGIFLGLFFILLLNRWFKSNVATVSSILAVLSSSFLYISGSGTPLIMTVFWPTILLWLGSKIQGINKPNPWFCFIFAIFLLLSIFTPYMVYLSLFIILYVLLHPHLRFTIKHLPKVPLFLTALIILSGRIFIVVNILKNHNTITQLLFTSNFSWNHYFNNIKNAMLPFFHWSGVVESTFLAPLIGLASLTLAVIGLISTYHGFFASRNSIALYLIIFITAISGFSTSFSILLILPLAILIAHGLRYIINKWYRLFPKNPYARVFGFIPIFIFLFIIVISDISHFIFGYRYNPAVANQFSTDLELINHHIQDQTTIITEEDSLYHFYKLLEKKPLLGQRKTVYIAKNLSLLSPKIATFKPISNDNYTLFRIITNSKAQNSDRIYLYQLK